MSKMHLPTVATIVTTFLTVAAPLHGGVPRRRPPGAAGSESSGGRRQTTAADRAAGVSQPSLRVGTARGRSPQQAQATRWFSFTLADLVSMERQVSSRWPAEILETGPGDFLIINYYGGRPSDAELAAEPVAVLMQACAGGDGRAASGAVWNRSEECGGRGDSAADGRERIHLRPGDGKDRKLGAIDGRLRGQLRRPFRGGHGVAQGLSDARSTDLSRRPLRDDGEIPGAGGLGRLRRESLSLGQRGRAPAGHLLSRRLARWPVEPRWNSPEIRSAWSLRTRKANPRPCRAAAAGFACRSWWTATGCPSTSGAGG